MRALLLFVIGLTFGGTGGFLVAGGMGESSHDHAGHSDATHDHETLTEWAGAPPELSLNLTPDLGSDLNLRITATGFTFAPAQVNGPVSDRSGHGHVYVNGEKVARAYGPYMHLTNVPKDATIRVTLNANDHSGWSLNGKPIAAEATAP
jgi:hypothetical protein